MAASDAMAAKLLEVSAASLAADATNLLLERLAEWERVLSSQAFGRWKANLQQRLLELSIALHEGEPRLFAGRVQWARTAFRARAVPEDELRESLLCLREILSNELPQHARLSAVEYLDQGLQVFEQPAAETIGLDPSDPRAAIALKYLVEVLEGNSRQAIDLIVQAVSEGLSIQDAYSHVLLPIQREVGRMWHLSEISIAEEHYVTATTERAMSILTYRAAPKPFNELTVVSAAVANNVHSIGVRAVADFFELDGWRSICLGADAPTADIVRAVEDFHSDLLLLSASMSTQLKTVRDVIEQVRQGMRADCKVLVGGSAFDDCPDIWKQLGADGFADNASEAVSQGNKLLQS